MSRDELIAALEVLRTRLRDQAHLFEDPAAYADGVEDALDLVERVAAGEQTDGQTDEQLAS